MTDKIPKDLVTIKTLRISVIKLEKEVALLKAEKSKLQTSIQTFMKTNTRDITILKKQLNTLSNKAQTNESDIRHLSSKR